MKIYRGFMPKASYARLHQAPEIGSGGNDLDCTCLASDYPERYARELSAGTSAADESVDWQAMAVKQACERVLKREFVTVANLTGADFLFHCTTPEDQSNFTPIVRPGHA